jgi:hypothetical protein
MINSGNALMRMRRRFVARFERMRGESGERGVALMSAMLFMVLLAGMSLVLLSVIVSQIGPSFAAQKGTKTVYAAQGGLQAALGVVRSAAAPPNATGAVFGAPSKLPCTFEGNLDGATDSVSYVVNIGYYLVDPTGKNDAWLASPANKLNCSTPGGVSVTPLFAYLVSEGTGTSAFGREADEANRSVAAIYKFKVTNVNVSGGRIYDFDRTQCLEAVPTTGTTIESGSLVRFRAMGSTGCSTNDARQLWIYDNSYQIKLASSVDAGAPLCITGREGTASLPQRTVLRPCLLPANGDARFNQLWSWTGGHTWKGQLNPVSHGVDNNMFISRSDADPVSSIRYLQVTANDSYDFSPTAAVGAGAASVSTHQLVNYKEFGRCADVTGGVETATFMISYPCKQDPTGTGNFIEWNHKLYYTEATTAAGVVQPITMQIGNNMGVPDRRCLVVPEDTDASKYPVIKPCASTGTPDRQSWTRINNTGDYAGSYLVLDVYGRCLTANSGDLYQTNWSKLTMNTCDGSLAQKWNAPPVFNDATFGSFREIG